MLYYLAALIWIYIVSLHAQRLPILVSIPASLPIVAFSALRGESGKDTLAYVERFYASDGVSTAFTIDSEPLITILLSFSRMTFGDDVRGFFALHAFLLFIIYFLISKKRALNGAYLLSVGPVFLLDGITNGMRVTLAYHALLLGYTYGNRAFVRYFFWMAALFAHITSAAAIALSLSLRHPRKTLVGFFLFFVAIYGITSGGLIDWMSLAPRVFSKLDKYSDLTLPTWYSGIIDLLTIWTLLLVSTLNTSISTSKKLLALLLSTLFCLLLYAGIQQSLAMIRISKLAIIALFTSQLFTQKRIRKYRLLIPTIGFLYTANYLRQVATDPGFLPYGE